MTPKALCACALLALVTAGFCGCKTVAPTPPVEDLQAKIDRTQARVFPSLVFLKPIKKGVATGEAALQQVFGSGVIISPDGLVATNSHVAIDATEINCVLRNSEMFPAKQVGIDPDTDLALLQIQLPAGHAPLPACEFADSDDLQAGQFVMAFGCPLGLTYSVSLGIVSCPRRYLELSPYNLWIQTDAAINPGNSGGPLADAQGRVIGITALRSAMGENLGFAIPSNTVQRVIKDLKAKHKVERTYTGVQLQPLKDFLHDVILPANDGVLVRGVDESSPAAAAGLKAGDLILSVDGLPVHGIYLEDIPQVRNQFASLAPDTPVKVEVRRGDKPLELTLSPIRKIALASEGLELPMWNCSVQEISKFRTPALAYFAPHGIYILGMRGQGNARASGFQIGDVILSIDKIKIATPTDIQEAYRRLSRLDAGRRTALFEILRGGYREFIVLDFNRDYHRTPE